MHATRFAAATTAALVFLSTFTSAPAHSSEIAAGSWRTLGTRWAAKLDPAGDVEAVYDLSYPYLFRRIKLATLDLSKKSIAETRARLEAAEPEDDASEKLRARALEAFSKLNVNPDWWRALPFKDPALNAAANPPQRFRMSELLIQDKKGRDLHWRQFVPKDQEAAVAAASPEDLDFFSLDALELQLRCQTEDGTPVYDIFWSPIEEGRGNALDPRKVIDFRKPGWILAKSLALDAIQTALGSLIGEIGIPVVSAVIGTVTGTFFRYRDLLNSVHLRMATEMLKVAEDGQAGQTDLSPFKGWVGDARRKAVLSLAYGNAALTDLALWIITPPMKAWDKSFISERKTARKLEGRLAKKGVTPAYINPRFAVGTWKNGNERLFQMAHKKLIGAPYKSIDYGKPNAEKNVRPVIAAGEVLVGFATKFIPVPYVGSVISGAYNLLLSNPMRASISQEAQLIAYLEEIPSNASSIIDVDRTLDILYAQRLNPFALDRAKTQALIEARKAKLGI